MMTVDVPDGNDTQLVVRENYDVVQYGQIAQLPTWMLEAANKWLIPVNKIPEALQQEQLTGKTNRFLEILRHLSAAEGYEENDPRLQNILPQMAKDFVADMKAIKNKALSYMAILAMYLQQLEDYNIYYYIGGECNNVEDFCINHVGMSPSFYQQIQQVGEYCRVLQMVEFDLTKMFEIPLGHITYSFLNGLKKTITMRHEEDVVKKAEQIYPTIVKEVQEELENTPPPTRGRDAVPGQNSLAQAILARLPEQERTQLSQEAFKDTKEFAQDRFTSIVVQGNGALANYKEEKGEVVKEKGYILHECTYDPKTGRYEEHSITFFSYEHGLSMARGLLKQLWHVEGVDKNMTLSELGDWIATCTEPSIVPSTGYTVPSRPVIDMDSEY